jgi:tetratricopeptide (TPR) repeat protein
VVDVGLFHHRQELPRVGRQRLDVAPLALGIDGIEGQRRLARAGQAGDHDQLVARQVEVDVLEVVGACRDRLREYLIAEGRSDEVLALVATSEAPVDRAVEAFIQTRYAEALAWCEGRLKTAPDDAFAQLHRARAVHNLGQHEAALGQFRTLVKAHPDFAEAWAACAHALRASGQEVAACQAYERALEQSPGLRQARLNLGITLLNQDRAAAAQQCFETLLDRNGDDVEAMVYLGLALRLNGQEAMAIRRLKRALILQPDHVEAHRYLAGLYNQAGQVDEALHHLRQALKRSPEDPDLIADLADIHELSSELDKAAEQVARGLKAAPMHPQLNLMAARLDRRAGDLEAAEQRLRSLDERAFPPRLALQLAQERGLVFDRLRKAEEAWPQFERANELAAGDGRLATVDRQAFPRALTVIGEGLDEVVSQAPVEDDDGSDLIFLIGFTRSGTTLLDTFFKARADLVTVEEKPTIERVIDMHGLQALGCQAVHAMSAEARSALRQRYRQFLGSWIPRQWQGAVIDRMPLRLIHAALIHQLFPRARFVLALRHPCDVVLSNFMQIFEPGDALVHCNTLASTAQLYDQVMQLWMRIEPLLGDRVIETRYEDLVGEPEAELSRLCRALDLDFDPAVLDRDRRVAAAGRVRTASYQQVHEPLYSRAVGRWQRYADHFEPHLELLAPHAARMGYSMS